MNNFLDTLRPQVLQRAEHIKLHTNNKVTNDTHLKEMDFLTIFREKKPVIIAEIKFASPSKGDVYKGNLDHVAIAKSYLKNGASALSVLTEPNYFKGNIKYIKDIRNACPECHILLKDFVLDKRQILQGKEYGANAVLLIAAFLEFEQMKFLYNFALDLGLTPLIEIHTAKELERVLTLKPQLIGINNRDLRSLKIDLTVSRELIKGIEDNIYVISESGIDNAKTMKEMIGLGFDGFLIGSSFMQSPDPGLALDKILREFE